MQSWMLTATGVAFNLGRPKAADVNLTDIAHHLARIPRFNGATRRVYSVAEHSVLVASLVEHELGITDPCGILAALMHDAHEAYLGDISTPVKHLLGDKLQVLEWSLQAAVQQRYGLQTPTRAYHEQIRRADLMALATEKRDLMPDNPAPWAVLTGIEPRARRLDLTEIPAQVWQRTFITRFNELNMARVLKMDAYCHGAEERAGAAAFTTEA